MSLEDILRDPTITQSLREALIEYHETHGVIPSRRRWFILFGPDHEPAVRESRWMLM